MCAVERHMQRSPAGGMIKSPPGLSVEARWPPLTPEHGFPSLHIWPGRRALPLRPARARARTPSFFCRASPPFKVSRVRKKAPLREPRLSALTPYVGITRIRSKGRSSRFLSAREGLPRFYTDIISLRAAFVKRAGQICAGVLHFPLRSSMMYLNLTMGSP